MKIDIDNQRILVAWKNISDYVRNMEQPEYSFEGDIELIELVINESIKGDLK